MGSSTSHRCRNPAGSVALVGVFGRTSVGAGGRGVASWILATTDTDPATTARTTSAGVRWQSSLLMRGLGSGSISSRRLEEPTLPIAVGLEPVEGRLAAAGGGQRERFLRRRDHLGHHTIRAVGELVDAPQL